MKLPIHTTIRAAVAMALLMGLSATAQDTTVHVSQA